MLHLDHASQRALIVCMCVSSKSGTVYVDSRPDCACNLAVRTMLHVLRSVEADLIFVVRSYTDATLSPHALPVICLSFKA